MLLGILDVRAQHGRPNESSPVDIDEYEFDIGISTRLRLHMAQSRPHLIDDLYSIQYSHLSRLVTTYVPFIKSRSIRFEFPTAQYQSSE